MLLPSFKKLDAPNLVPCKSSYKRLTTSQTVNDGVISSQSVFEDYDIAANNAQFSASDFSIKNLLAIGATNILNGSAPSLSVSPLRVSDTAQQFEVKYSQPQETKQ